MHQWCKMVCPWPTHRPSINDGPRTLAHSTHHSHKHKKQTMQPWRPPERSRHHPYLPPHMGDHPQTFFIPFSTSLRTIRCVGSFSATPDCTSAADDRHGHANSRIHQLRTSSNSRWSHFTSNLNGTTSPRFRIIRGSISYVLVGIGWVSSVQSSIFSQIITNY